MAPHRHRPIRPPGWDVEDDEASTRYTAPGHHLTVHLDHTGWTFEARPAPQANPVWRATFHPDVPVDAMAAFATTLLRPDL